jgi:hypothetical protein
MTTWVNDGYAAGLFKLNGTYLPPPPAGVQPPPLWGDESHIEEVFAAAGATPDIARETFDLQFASERAAIDEYTTTFGPFVTARSVLEPQGRWPEFVQASRTTSTTTARKATTLVSTKRAPLAGAPFV